MNTAGDNAAVSEETKRQYEFIQKARALVNKRSDAIGRKLTFYVRTFGCQMNFLGSEKLVGILKEIGYVEAKSEEADFVLYNTCTVRENANNKVYGRLGVLHGIKRKNPKMKIALCGCMMQEPTVVDTIQKTYPFVDLVFGTHNIYKLPELFVTMWEAGGQIIDIWDSYKDIVEDLPAERKYRFKSGVNIMYGCNNFCTYCIVPYVRGRERSRNPLDILREIERLAADGVVEVMLLGQNVNSYGKTLDTKITFAGLLKEVTQIDGIERIRFMTSHPKDLSDELIEVMAGSDKICKHLHLPLQSGSTRLLSLMNRHYEKEDYLRLTDKIRAAMPDIALTTDIIVGFPGETEEDFNETMRVVEQVRYDSAFTFIYSKRTGTPAAKWTTQIPEDVVQRRFDRLLAAVQRIGAEKAEKFTGTIQKVLVEQINKQDKTLLTGRMDNNSVVHFPGDESLIGKIVDVELVWCKGFYYMGRKSEK
ncbi:MAG: tRNA (N6-isopentenyl adenosine(37)-C2)-methylthiotransferase MiaB [Lachnospiraceae bacterium]|nr:tRNA (N6-isopentenyl adenosine(37)-C2)-methylthiotransferase MiaB [Lachnospiraceae bacterium]